MTDYDVHTVETIELDRGAGAAKGTDRDGLIAALAWVALVRCRDRGWRGPRHFSNNYM